LRSQHGATAVPILGAIALVGIALMLERVIPAIRGQQWAAVADRPWNRNPRDPGVSTPRSSTTSV
jgi:hypothetical protein